MVVWVEDWRSLGKVRDGVGWIEVWLIVPLDMCQLNLKTGGDRILTFKTKSPCSPQTDGVGPSGAADVVFVYQAVEVLATAAEKVQDDDEAVFADSNVLNEAGTIVVAGAV